MTSPFHEGERRAQELAGETRMADRNGAMISNQIRGFAIVFLEQQSMAVMGSEDAKGRLWCSLVFGSPGFLQPGGSTLDVDLESVEIDAADPFWTNIEANHKIGMLVIDLVTKKRFRINGTVTREERKLHVSISEAFPNCAQYITRRQLRKTKAGLRVADAYGHSLGANQVASVRAADTLFVTSGHSTRGLDTSHRGGMAGFVEVVDSNTLRIPDYPGNSMFNTFGNLLTNPHAGLAIPDFGEERLLQLTGEADVQLQGAHRFWDFHIREWREADIASAAV